MAEVTLEVQDRNDAGKGVARKLRAQGQIPAVVYGGHRDPAKITVDRKAISELIHKSEHGVRSIFLLKMAGTEQQRHAMIKDIQMDPISRKMKHIDFVRVMMDEKIKTTVPIHIVGVAQGVKEGGILDWHIREVRVECFPNQIPDKIDIDVTSLNTHDFRSIKDLVLPEGIRVLDDGERNIVGITHAKAEVVAVEAVVEPTAVAEPEVITKGKKPEAEKA
jgi:large subunit ribosomal protein L25